MIIDIWASGSSEFFYNDLDFSYQLNNELSRDLGQDYISKSTRRTLEKLKESEQNQKDCHPQEWLFFKFLENCTVSNYIFDTCKRLDIIKSECIIRKNESELSDQLVTLIRSMELDFVVVRKDFISTERATLMLDVAHTDFSYDLIDYLFKNSM